MRRERAGNEQVHPSFKRLANPAKTPPTPLHVGRDVRHGGAVAQPHHRRALRGRAKVTAQGADGADTAINVMGPGEVFGEIGILDGQPRSATVTTLEECEMAVVDECAFHGLLAASPPVAVKLLAVLAGRIRELTLRVEDRAFLDVPARLAKQLLWLAGNHGTESGGRVRIELKLSQRELGDFISATRESVNKNLRDWSRSGFIKHERDYLEILDLDALRAIAERR